MYQKSCKVRKIICKENLTTTIGSSLERKQLHLILMETTLELKIGEKTANNGRIGKNLCDMYVNDLGKILLVVLYLYHRILPITYHKEERLHES